ncbi:hypothetical protein D9M68_704630 [compost metagenome]
MTAPPMVLRVELNSAAVASLMDQLQHDLSAFEQLPEFPLESFLRLGDALSHDLSVEPLGPTATAGDERIVLRVVGHLELFAAAIGALQRYLCHLTSPSPG